MSLVFRVGADHLSEVLSCRVSPESKLLVELPVVVLSSIWLTVCATCFSISPMILPSSVSISELDCGEIPLTTAGVLWFTGSGRQIFFYKFCTVLCTCIRPQMAVLWKGCATPHWHSYLLVPLHLMRKDQVPLHLSISIPWLLGLSFSLLHTPLFCDFNGYEYSTCVWI